jgi:GNAT superfamily N-acetyltransferase
VAGYGILIWKSQYPPFNAAKIPEINDLRVSGRFLRQGIAAALVARFEELAVANGCAAIGLSVGLCTDFGPAQRLYAKLGFIPDGKGVAWNNQPAEPGASVRVDDDLLLWVVKDFGQRP